MDPFVLGPILGRSLFLPRDAELWVNEIEAAAIVAEAIERGILPEGTEQLPAGARLWGRELLVVQGGAEV